MSKPKLKIIEEVFAKTTTVDGLESEYKKLFDYSGMPNKVHIACFKANKARLQSTSHNIDVKTYKWLAQGNPYEREGKRTDGFHVGVFEGKSVIVTTNEKIIFVTENKWDVPNGKYFHYKGILHPHWDRPFSEEIFQIIPHNTSKVYRTEGINLDVLDRHITVEFKDNDVLFSTEKNNYMPIFIDSNDLRKILKKQIIISVMVNNHNNILRLNLKNGNIGVLMMHKNRH